jgi:hypothetical protein
LNITEAIKRSLEEPTLTKALCWIAVWENDRAVHQALRNNASGERGYDGRMWDTCFEHCFDEVIFAWNKREAQKSMIEVGP